MFRSASNLAFLGFIITLAQSMDAGAAACCGGGFASPSLISGDEKAQVTTAYSYSQIQADVYPDALWRRRQARESVEAIKFDAAHIFYDRFQAGVSLPVIRRLREDEGATGLGDAAMTLGYEALPDWDYNPWRPKGLTYLQMILPTGQTVQEAEAPYQLDARGRGFWALGAGALLTKVLGRWDLFTSLDAHTSFERRYSNADGSGRLIPGLGGQLGLGAGYSLGDYRAGGSLTWIYEDGIDVTGSVPSTGTPQRFATAVVSVSRMVGEEWAGTLSYQDQMLFGRPLNTSLSRGILFQLQRRWSR